MKTKLIEFFSFELFKKKKSNFSKFPINKEEINGR